MLDDHVQRHDPGSMRPAQSMSPSPPRDGTSSTSSSDQFTYDATPVVTGIAPVAGPIAGNTSVTITGTGFVVGSSTVAFGSTAGTSVSCSSTTSCSAKSPAGSAGTVDVTVTTPGGTSSTSSSDQFTYDATPVVTGIAPVAGPIAGNTSVTITGTGFADATGVKFASGNASSYTIVSDIQITAASPAHAAGTVDVTVTNETGTSSTSSSDQFSYDATPAVTAVSPVAGPIAGNTSVTITGTGFVVGSSTVAFGADAGTSVSCSSTTSCSATSPSGSAGTVDVTVTTPGGTSSTSSSDQFTYDTTPVVTGIAPVAGPIAGNTSVTITGTGFVVGSSTVAFGSTAGTSVTCSSTTSCSATSPPARPGQSM